MNLPDFEIFLEAINKDALQEVVEDSIGSRIIYTDNLLKDGNFSELLTQIIYQSVEISSKISLIYLQTYHQWLQRQFEQSSGDPG